MARPKKEKSKTKVLNVRVTEEDYIVLKEMTYRYETTLSSLILDSLRYKIAIFKSQKR